MYLAHGFYEQLHCDCVVSSNALERNIGQLRKRSHSQYGFVNGGYLLNFMPILGFLFGNDVLRLFHGNDECLTIPENWSEHPAHKYIFFFKIIFMIFKNLELFKIVGSYF